MQAHFAMFAHYNRWANERLYDATAKLSEAEFRADRGAFFGSVAGTLNHLLVTDRIWMRRLTARGPEPVPLDTILHEAFGPLAAARREEDERIIGFIDTLSGGDFDAMIAYRTMSNPVDIRQPLGTVLAHIFNHQTHHRGQVHCLISAIAGRDAAPSLDLIAFQRLTGIGMG